nr:hypothetical protein CFP56_65820 [Quercus suber]
MAMAMLLGSDASPRVGMQHRNLNSNKKKKTLFSGSGYDEESAISMLSSTTASTSSAAMNGEKKRKACNVIRMKVPKDFKLDDYNKESDAKNVTDSTCTNDSCCSSTTMLNGDDGITNKKRGLWSRSIWLYGGKGKRNNNRRNQVHQLKPSTHVLKSNNNNRWNQVHQLKQSTQPGIRVLRFYLSLGKENMMEHIGDIPSVYKWEMMNKAVHAADRGGNLNVLK